VRDTSPQVANNELKRYRTTVRVTFDNDEDRRKASARWRLWRQGRALDDDLPLDRLRAIDFDAGETRSVIEKHSNTETTLTSAAAHGRPGRHTVSNPDLTVFIDDSVAAFDRFTVTWSSRASEPVLHFIVRFIVLSTDFSHSKGTKGFVIRLISKTEYLGPSPASEICYCKVQSFRDKGAERKMQNDREAVEGQIKRTRAALQKIKLGIPETSSPTKKKSRRRSVDSDVSSRRNRRDWSSLSASPTNSLARDEELQKKMDKLRLLEARFATVQPINVFCLRGDQTDDPCAPESFIVLNGQNEEMIALQEDKFRTRMMKLDSQTSSRLSGSGSENSPGAQAIHPLSPQNPVPTINGMVPNDRVRVQAATKEIDAVDVNPYYISMPRPTINPGTPHLKPSNSQRSVYSSLPRKSHSLGTYTCRTWNRRRCTMRCMSLNAPQIRFPTPWPRK
jgi:CP2 transcription factor